MGNAKREALALIQQLPDNSSLEDIQFFIFYIGKRWNMACAT